MSKLPTFVQFGDGVWYKNPVLGEGDWFLCFDDEEPPEIVIKKGAFEAGLTPQRIIQEQRFEARIVSARIFESNRCFESKIIKLEPAVSCHIHLYRAPYPSCPMKSNDGHSMFPPRCECSLYQFLGKEEHWDNLRRRDDEYYKPKSERLYDKIKEYLSVPSKIFISKKGHSRLLVNGKGVEYIVHYSESENGFSIFYSNPSSSDKQYVVQCKIWQDVVEFFEKFGIVKTTSKAEVCNG